MCESTSVHLHQSWTANQSCHFCARLPSLLWSNLGEPCMAWGGNWRVARITVRLGSSLQPWHLRNEVCFWVLQVGRCKTLPPDTNTFLHRVLERAIEALKSLPNHCQELSNIDGKCSSGRKRDPQVWMEKEAAYWESWKESLMLVLIFRLWWYKPCP